MRRLPEALRRAAGPGGPWLNRATALLLSVWIVHGLLRAALLFRRDAFGFPLVGKADWYIFHALCVDLHWIFLWSFPWLLLLALGARWLPRACPALLAALAVFHGTLLLLTVIDHETLRFMGMHFDPGMARTYGNSAAVREVFHFIASDKSVVGLPYALFFGSIPLAALFYRGLSRTRWARAQAWSLGPVAWILGGCLVGYLYLYQIWPGGFRMARLRPFVQSALLSLHREEEAPLPADSLALLTRDWRERWRAAGTDTGWTFPLAEYPYYKEPTAPACVSRGADIPGNGVDEDCNGVDAQPWNFILLLLESHRALNVGHLRPYGALDSATPFLDSLAHAGHFWTRAVISGIPTINALIATHLSIHEHPTRLISSDFVSLRHRAFTSVLARHGYLTHFFSAADPAWDNQTPWLRRWYQGWSYDRGREEDGLMFAHMARWLRDSLPPGKSFFAAAMTKTNHYPFNPVRGVKTLPGSATLTQRMSATMAYTDSCMRAFVDSLRSLPWFRHTIFIVMADHGFPLSEHGSSSIGYGLYTENVWVPLVMAGAHPKLGSPREHGELAAQMDVGPTLLDLAGIRDPNAFMGHTLVSPGPPERQFSFCSRGEQALVERGLYRWHGPWGSVPREQGEEMFDIIRDRLEHRNVLANHTALRDSLLDLANATVRLHLHVLENDRLWPDSI